MINVKKGNAHSLHQTDYRGTNNNPAQYGTTPYTSGTNYLYAGMLAYINSSGVVLPFPASGGSASSIKGFVINNNFDGDAIESQKIALYALDGSSIIETDQVDLTQDSVTAINLTNYPLGTPIYASGGTAGLVSKTSGSGAYGTIIGWVENVRFLQNATPYPAGSSSSQSYTSATETAAVAAETATSNGQPIYSPSSKTATYKAQINVPVLSIKLAAA